jgi:hypothetical protein
MNFVSHGRVTGLVGYGPIVQFASMLPDFVSDTLRLDESGLPEKELQIGIEIHKQADQVFHSHDQFRAWCFELRDLLGPLATRPALATAHVCIELLIDGFVLANPTRRANYEMSLSSTAEYVSGPWSEKLSELASDFPTCWYTSPLGVATRTLEILSRRRIGEAITIAPGQLSEALMSIAGPIEADYELLLSECATALTNFPGQAS